MRQPSIDMMRHALSAGGRRELKLPPIERRRACRCLPQLQRALALSDPLLYPRQKVILDWAKGICEVSRGGKRRRMTPRQLADCLDRLIDE